MVLGRSQRLSIFLNICNWKKIRGKKEGENWYGFFWWGLGVGLCFVIGFWFAFF